MAVSHSRLLHVRTIADASVLSDKISTISTFESILQETDCSEIFGVVIYDLPGRDCAAKASNGELAVGQVDEYKSQYIDRRFLLAITKTG